MIDIFQYFSGNIPGGILLYFFLLGLFVFALWMVSNRNDLFTARHARMAFVGLFLLTTLVYIFLWRSDPPPEVFSRYATWFHADEEEDQWLAWCFRDEMAERVFPWRDQTDYFYPQKWHLMIGQSCTVSETVETCRDLYRRVPIRDIVEGRIARSDTELSLILTLHQGSSSRKLAVIPLDPARPDEALTRSIDAIGSRWPFRKFLITNVIADSSFHIARNFFYNGDYQKCTEYLKTALRQSPGDENIRKWLAYTSIRRAAELKRIKIDASPYHTQRKGWEIEAETARKHLINLARTTYETDRADPLLSNMIAEGYLLESRFDEAEKFLKIAYGENPFNAEVLNNMYRLHFSRYTDLGFKDVDELLRYLLLICPVHPEGMNRYVDRQVIAAPVSAEAQNALEAVIRPYRRIAPNSVDGIVHEARFKNSKGEYADALKLFRAADSLRPGTAYLKFDLGVTRYKLKKLDEAEADFREAIRLGNYLNAHLYIGVIHQERGEYKEALESYNYRVMNRLQGEDNYAEQAVKGIKACLEALQSEQNK